MLRNILFGLGLFATILSILIFSGKISIGGKGNSPEGEVFLWGTLPENEMNAVVQSFNPQSQSYTVRYKYIPAQDFSMRLLEALANGTGPDMILAPYQTILAQRDRIQPFPVASFGEKAFKDMYVDGASIFYTEQGALAFPVSIDPMVLFYNRSLFSKRGMINPPSYWDELISTVPLMITKENGKLTEAAIALGTPNTPYAKDIIMTIVAQLGQVPVLKAFNQMGEIYFDVTVNEPIPTATDIYPLVTVNRFFTQFGDPGQVTFTWPQTAGEASDAFIAEKLAMYIGYSGELSTLRARNPRGEFAMTYLPQTKGYNTFATGMRMHGIATLKSSKNMNTSFTVQSQFAGGGVSPAIAAITGAVPGLRAYAATPGLDPVVARSMLVARGWYDSYERETSSYIAQMISDIINYRYGVTDATNLFVSRMKDLYAKH